MCIRDRLKSGAFVIAAEAGVDMIPCRIIYKGGKDVYKRQGVDMVSEARVARSIKRPGFLEKVYGPAERALLAVSYTHLDVYKRQGHGKKAAFYEFLKGAKTGEAKSLAALGVEFY